MFTAPDGHSLLGHPSDSFGCICCGTVFSHSEVITTRLLLCFQVVTVLATVATDASDENLVIKHAPSVLTLHASYISLQFLSLLLIRVIFIWRSSFNFIIFFSLPMNM